MSTIEKLLSYQEEDKKLFEIEKLLNGCPARIKGIEAKNFLRSVGETLAGIDAKSQELCNSYNMVISSLDKIKEENSEFDLIAEKVADEKEISYLKAKANEVTKQLNDLINKVNKIKAEMHEVAVQYAKIRKEISLNQEIYQTSSEEYSKLKKENEPSKKAIEENLSKLEKDIPTEIMNKYREKRKDKKFPVIYKIQNKHCGACGTELSMLQLDKLDNDGTVIECENCRRLIFK